MVIFICDSVAYFGASAISLIYSIRILKLSLEDTVLPIELEIVPSYYAEVNPEAVENKPDKSQVYSFQDQQAADTSVREDNSPVPLINGSEAYASKIVSAEVVSEEAQLSQGIYKISANKNTKMESDSGQTIVKAHAEAALTAKQILLSLKK